MTEPNTTSEPDSTQNVHTVDGDQDDQEARTPNRREASYRIKAREAEAAVSVLEERVARMQRDEVERMAARLHDPADLWGFGVELLELLDEDGEVDPERVAEAVAVLADSKPYLLRPKRGSNFGQGRRTPVDTSDGTSWGMVLRGR
jgi:hypothetical protein